MSYTSDAAERKGSEMNLGFFCQDSGAKRAFPEVVSSARGVGIRAGIKSGTPLVMLSMKHLGGEKQVIMCRSRDLAV